jgi:phospholipid/cholesterol/gamma-HCH transport system substrate-binding protein
LLVHIDSAATNINDALVDARRTILGTRSLTNLSATFDNFHAVSERSLTLVDNVDALVETNRPAITAAASNLVFFSEQLSQSAGALHALVATNSPDIEKAVKNIESSSATLRQLLEGVQEGKGFAGKLLENEEIAANVSQIVSNLNTTTSNLNRLGLWGILWKHKPPRTDTPAPRHEPMTAPKNPLE